MARLRVMLACVRQKNTSHPATTAEPAFNAQALLDSSGLAKTVRQYGRGETIFTQGNDSADVLYIQTGGVKLAMQSKTGREAVMAVLGPGDFFGEGCLAGQRVRTGSAIAITPCRIRILGKDRMLRLLHQQHAMSDRFISRVLSRNIQTEGDFIDQLFNSSEKRLARALLLLARHDTQGTPACCAEDFTREARDDRRRDAPTREVPAGQIPKTALHRMSRPRPSQDQKLAAQRRPPRLTAGIVSPG
jgi:CRP-like cAMP-binding protein